MILQRVTEYNKSLSQRESYSRELKKITPDVGVANNLISWIIYKIRAEEKYFQFMRLVKARTWTSALSNRKSKFGKSH